MELFYEFNNYDLILNQKNLKSKACPPTESIDPPGNRSNRGSLCSSSKPGGKGAIEGAEGFLGPLRKRGEICEEGK